MIERPDNLDSVEIDIEFNFQKFNFLEVDLCHINKAGRSNFRVKDISFVVTRFIHGSRLSASDEKEFGDEFCSYFVKRGEFENKSYKLVFCICSDKPTSLGVITLHRI